MKKYYLHNGAENIGPFDIEELKTQNITRTTSVWCEGMIDWKNAADVEELQTIFASTPPPIKVVPPPIQLKKETVKEEKGTHWLIVALRKTVLLILLVVLVGAAINHFSEDETTDTPPPEAESVMSVSQMEATYPLNYLETSGSYNTNFLGTKYTIEGIIDNKATITAYKNVTIEIKMYDESKKEIGSEKFTVNNFFPANSRKTFTHKILRHNNVSSIGWVVSNAVANR